MTRPRHAPLAILGILSFAAPSAAQTATQSWLLLSVDVPCKVSIDGAPPIAVRAGQPRKVGTTPGQHLVIGDCEGGENWEKEVETKPGQQALVTIRVVKARQQQAQEQAAMAAQAESQAQAIDATLLQAAGSLVDIVALYQRDCAQWVEARNAAQSYRDAQVKQQNQEQWLALGNQLLNGGPPVGMPAMIPQALMPSYVPSTAGQQAQALGGRVEAELAGIPPADPLRNSLKADFTKWTRLFQSLGDGVCAPMRTSRALPVVQGLDELLSWPTAEQALSPAAWDFWTARRGVQMCDAFGARRVEALARLSQTGAGLEEQGVKLLEENADAGDEAAGWWLVVAGKRQSPKSATGVALTPPAELACSEPGERSALEFYARWQGVGPYDKLDAKTLRKTAKAMGAEMCAQDGMSLRGCVMTALALYETTDYKEAAVFGQRACQAGLPRGCAIWGALLVDGFGIRADPAKGLGLLQGACKDGDKAACVMAEKACSGSSLPACRGRD